MHERADLRFCWARALILGLAFALAALLGISLLQESFPRILAAVGSALSLDWEALSQEAAARYPELAGVIVGQLLLLAFVFYVRTRRPA
jgi:hypothetical protein